MVTHIAHESFTRYWLEFWRKITQDHVSLLFNKPALDSLLGHLMVKLFGKEMYSKCSVRDGPTQSHPPAVLP